MQAALALDKQLQLAAASQAGLDIPRTSVARTAHELRDAVTEFPVVLKSSAAIRAESNRLTRGESFVCANAAELATAEAAWAERYTLLVQPMLIGVGEGIFGLSGAGDELILSAHRRVRMMNPQGSGSSACESIRVDPELTGPAARFVRAADWRGLFMLEFSAGSSWARLVHGAEWPRVGKHGSCAAPWARLSRVGGAGGCRSVISSGPARRQAGDRLPTSGARDRAFCIFAPRSNEQRQCRLAPTARDSPAPTDPAPERPLVQLASQRLAGVRGGHRSNSCWTAQAEEVVTLRAAVHVHSDWSDDGCWRLSDLVRGFERRRYRAILLAEHDRGWDDKRWGAYREACRLHSSPRCALVPGIEYGDAENVVHVTVWGDLPFLGAGRPTLEILEAARAAGGVSVFAHPGRRDAYARFTPEWATMLNGIEVWNRKYDGWAPSREALRLAAAHPHLRVLAGNDFHTRRQFFPFSLLVEATGEVEEIYAALAAGQYEPRVFSASLGFFAGDPALAAALRLEALRLRVAVPLRRLRRWRARRSASPRV